VLLGNSRKAVVSIPAGRNRPWPHLIDPVLVDVTSLTRLANFGGVTFRIPKFTRATPRQSLKIRQGARIAL